jgi:spore coat polysaccharide biosynthesis protein SpsF
MTDETKFKTEQEAFWAGNFGTEYIGRNEGPALLASNLAFFSRALARAGKLGSCIEFGANVGMNLRALQLLYPGMTLAGIEINADAADTLAKHIGSGGVHRGSILDYRQSVKYDLTLIKGVLIHINPEQLPVVYQKLHESTGRFLLVAEYYNPAPVAIPYRGHADRLFKRDFAGEILERYPDLRLVDYGFLYRRDPAFPHDDITWFLMERNA